MSALLLNPGPVTLSERVRRALLEPDLCHRESEYSDLQTEIRARLLQVYGLSPDPWASVLLTGSGTAAVEAMISTLVPADGRLLVLENGVYGERMSEMARRHAIPVEALSASWEAAIDLEGLRQRLATGAFTHLAVVHHETTTGRLNPLARVIEIAAAAGVQVLVDGVSSFGGEPIDFSHAALAAVAGTGNKCLHGIPGAAFVVTRRPALARAAARTLYLDLADWCRAQDQQGTPFTPSIPAYYALREALREHAEEGGVSARHARFAALAEQVAQGLAQRGIRPVLPAGESSVVLRAYFLPAGVTYSALHDHLKARGFVIYAGQARLAQTLFRISTMGALSVADMDRLLAAFSELLGIRSTAA
jgi:2-aminoethylphosphonate-pyruvate transaminase